MVMPSFARVRITASTSPTICGSNAEVGSSNSSTSGSIARARAMATRCFCPPEICFGFALMYGAMPTFSRYFMAFFFASSLERFNTLVWPIMQFSRTVRLLNRLKLWNTMPTLERYAGTLTPLSVMSFS